MVTGNHNHTAWLSRIMATAPTAILALYIRLLTAKMLAVNNTMAIWNRLPA
jgi:hypothetical protein